MTGILEAIDGTLAEWRGSADAMRWSTAAPPFPRLNGPQAAVARRLCADTGIDGYAAAVIVADVSDLGALSPWWDDVRPAALKVMDEAEREAKARIEAWLAEHARAIQEFGESLAAALTPVLRAAVDAFHGFASALEPRRHRDRCRACNPRGNPGPLAVNGHEYRRRQLARQKRRKRGR